jgi:aspartyl-tRNA(Asn)/glutamyl-tRNA(Gln) amidotransferase subunit A
MMPILKAQKVRRKLVEKTQLVFNEFDFILMPTSPSVAFKIGEKTDDPIAMYLADIYTVFANLTGIPDIITTFKHSNGMPFGQLMAKQFNELSLVQASQQLMEFRSVSTVFIYNAFSIYDINFSATITVTAQVWIQL